MNERVKAFLQQNHSAAMITLRSDGTPHVARVGVVLVDGEIWSSGTQRRLRTRHLRRDPRSTLMVFDGGPNGFAYLGLETVVTILDGPDAPALSLRLFQTMQPQASSGRIAWFGQEKTYDEFRKVMAEEQRVVYQFEVKRAYGLY